VALTTYQRQGKKFEVYLEELLKDVGKRKVKRNVQYFKTYFQHRQVDVEFHDYHFWNSHIIVEAKYTGGVVKLKRRNDYQKKKQKISIDNIVNELEERRRYVGAREAILITNRKFEKSVYKEAENYSSIQVYDLGDLEKLEKNRGLFKRSRDVQKTINSINLKKYTEEAYHIYIGKRAK
tara:strand:+ start:16822 stop:17358 length:537 start_codon:yes stop_codon:yes gene_type:complete